jgi:hypothetical protein
MRSDTTSDDGVPVTMAADLWVLLDNAAHKIAAGLATLIIRIATHQCSLGCSLVATPARRQEDNSRKQIV